MIQDKTATATRMNAKETVLSLIKALNDHDYDKARTYANDNMTFMGVLGARNGADAYFDDMERMQFHYEIRKIFADEEEVCLIYDLDMGGVNVFGCGWYKLQNGKISSLRVVFDPRAVLEEKEKKN